MNQIRNLLFFAWLAVATLLWMAWSAEHAPKAPATANAAAAQADATIPASILSPNGAIPAAAGAAPAQSAQAPVAQAMPRSRSAPTCCACSSPATACWVADLLQYPRSEAAGSEPVRLLDTDPAHFYAARSLWVAGSGSNARPLAFAPVGDARSVALAPGQQQLVVPFEARTPEGVVVRRNSC